jgi:hypothetical protein
MKPAVVQSLSVSCGLLMVLAPALGCGGPVLAAAVIAVIAVLAGVASRRASTVAVVTAAVLVAFGDAAPVTAAVSGSAAAAYLVLGHTVNAAPTVTAPTVGAATGFAGVGLIAATSPLSAPWLPLLAPPAVLGIYVLTIYPYLGRSPTASR